MWPAEKLHKPTTQFCLWIIDHPPQVSITLSSVPCNNSHFHQTNFILLTCKKFRNREKKLLRASLLTVYNLNPPFFIFFALCWVHQPTTLAYVANLFLFQFPSKFIIRGSKLMLPNQPEFVNLEALIRKHQPTTLAYVARIWQEIPK